MGPRDLFYFFDEMFEIDFDHFFSENMFANAYSCASFPPVNVHVKSNKDLIFEFALAGYRDDEIMISFSGEHLILDLKNIKSKEEKEEISTIHRGIKKAEVKIEYVVPSDKYDTEKAHADCKNGMLTILIPAKEKIKPREVEISFSTT